MSLQLIDKPQQLPPGAWRKSDPDLPRRLINGAVDLHCHSGPSVMPRYFDHYEAMQEASSAGLRAILIKDHYYSATPATELLNKHFKHLGVTMLSGVVPAGMSRSSARRRTNSRWPPVTAWASMRPWVS